MFSFGFNHIFKYYDPITLKTQQLENNTAVYLLSSSTTSGNTVYFIKAVSCSLDQLKRCPTSNQLKYWPIDTLLLLTRAQQNKDLIKKIFPDGYLTTGTFSLDDVKNYLDLDPNMREEIDFTGVLADFPALEDGDIPLLEDVVPADPFSAQSPARHYIYENRGTVSTRSMLTRFGATTPPEPPPVTGNSNATVTQERQSPVASPRPNLNYWHAQALIHFRSRLSPQPNSMTPRTFMTAITSYAFGESHFNALVDLVDRRQIELPVALSQIEDLSPEEAERIAHGETRIGLHEQFKL